MVRILIICTLQFICLLAPAKEEWGIISLCCAHLRDKPSHASEMVTEAWMGTPVKVMEKEGEWFRIQTPDEYLSYVHSASIVLRDEGSIRWWQNSRRYIYTGYQGFVFDAPHKNALPVSDLVQGCILEASGRKEGSFLPVRLPDGRTGYVKAAEVEIFREWAQQAACMDKMSRLARQMMGVTYLWGGTSVKGMDCSGFTRILYSSVGILLRRDASQQAKTGEEIEISTWKQKAMPGDLFFFGKEKGRINHVAFYLGNGEYVHASGRVKVNSMNATSEKYLPLRLLAVRRIFGQEGTEGIIRLRNHPWYFGDGAF